MLLRFIGSVAVMLLVISSLRSSASAATCTLSISPTSGPATLTCYFTNTVSLASPESTWDYVKMYSNRIGGPSKTKEFFLTPSYGGTFYSSEALDEAGDWECYIIDKGTTQGGFGPRWSQATNHEWATVS